MTIPDPPITPMWDYVLLELRKRTHISIFLPEASDHSAGMGIFVSAIGMKKLLENGTIVDVQEPPFKVGDEVQASAEGMVKIQMPKQAGETEGRRFVLCRPERVVCVIDPAIYGPSA